MKQIISIVFLLALCTLTVSALSIPVATEEHPKLQFYKDSNYSIEQILEDLANDHKLANNSDSEDKKRTRRSSCHLTEIYGGKGGSYFDDGCRDGIHQIDIYSQGHTIRSIQVTYITRSGELSTAPVHGQTHGTFNRISFASNEKIVAVVGCAGYNSNLSGDRVFQLAFLTNIHKHVFGPYGPGMGQLFIVYKNVVSFIGFSGSDLDGIGFVY